MSTSVITTFFAILALLCLATTLLGIGLAVAARVSDGGRRARDRVGVELAGTGLWLAFLIAAVATGGSLYLSGGAGFTPCTLCWYQRIAMYPLAIILLVGALLRDRRVPLYAALFPVAGALISIYHIYIEVNPDKESATCRAGIPCSTRWIDEFGYVTIPVMALSGFVLIGLLLTVAFIAGRHEDGPAD